MRAYILCAILLFSAGCDSQKDNSDMSKAEVSVNLPFQTLVETGVSGVEKKAKLFEIIKDSVSLQKFYPKIETEKLGSVDFARETVLGVYGGDAIRIVALEKREACNRVVVKTRRYEESSPFYGIPYSPMHLVKVKGRGECYEFDETLEVVR